MNENQEVVDSANPERTAISLDDAMRIIRNEFGSVSPDPAVGAENMQDALLFLTDEGAAQNVREAFAVLGQYLVEKNEPATGQMPPAEGAMPQPEHQGGTEV